jgi:hypothetical protein
LWKESEIHNVAAWCGVNAFSFLPEDIARARQAQDTQHLNLKSIFTTLREFVERNNADTFVSGRLNQLFDKQMLLHLITHLKAIGIK